MPQNGTMKVSLRGNTPKNWRYIPTANRFVLNETGDHGNPREASLAEIKELYLSDVTDSSKSVFVTKQTRFLQAVKKVVSPQRNSKIE